MIGNLQCYVKELQSFCLSASIAICNYGTISWECSSLRRWTRNADLCKNPVSDFCYVYRVIPLNIPQF